MTAVNKEIEDLTDRLGLVNHRQDWGIGNAAARRVEEFIQICRTDGLTASQQYAMGELVLASMNEAPIEDLVDENLISKFHDFLTLGLHGLTEQIRYWASLTDHEAFPVSSLLENVVAG